MVVKVHLDPGDGGYVVAECPALPGCASQGKTREEALANIREAIEGWLEVQDDRAGSAERPEGVEVVEVAN
jgi:predicted RNase H-like HicB family nuclease